MAKAKASAAPPKTGGYLHWGDDLLRLSEAQAALIATVVDPGWGDVNLMRLSAGTRAIEALAAASTPPFGAGGRLVIVSLAADEAQTFLDELAAEWDARPPFEGNALLVEVPSLDRRRKGAKLLEARLTCRAFDLPKAWDAQKTLGPWIEERLSAQGARIAADAREALIGACGTDTFRLANELDKLLLWAGESRRIDLAAVRALVAATESDVFGLLGALAGGDKGAALLEVARLLRDDPYLPKLVAGLTTNLLLVKRAKTLAGAGMPNAEVAATLGVHPFRLQNLLREWSRWRAEHLQAALLGLAEVDRRSKQSAWPGELLMETWIIRFPGAWRPLPTASLV